MSQTLLKKQILFYLENKYPEPRAPYIQDLIESLKGGYCLGLALCHAAMDLVGKGDWWEEALERICAWDCQQASLQQSTADMPGAEQDPEDYRPQTLALLIIRVLYYMAAAQASFARHRQLLPENVHQFNIFEPTPEEEVPYFYILDSKNKKIRIRALNTLAGHLTAERISKELDKEKVIGRIGLVNNDEHSIRFGYQNDQWFIYDPSESNICKYFPNKEVFINEILSIQGADIAIAIASTTTENPGFTPITTLGFREIEELLAGKGVQTMALENPQAFIALLGKIQANPKASIKIRAELRENLTKPYSSGEKSVFYMIVRYRPEVLPSLCDWIFSEVGTRDPSHSWKEKLIFDSEMCEWLKKIFQLPSVLAAFIDWIQANPNLFYRPKLLPCLITALGLKDETGQTGLKSVTKYAPHLLPNLLNLFDKEEFIDISFQQPHLLAELYPLISLTSKTGKEFLKSLNKPNFFKIFVTSSLDNFFNLLHFISENPNEKTREVFRLCLDHIYFGPNIWEYLSKDLRLLCKFFDVVHQAGGLNHFIERSTDWIINIVKYNPTHLVPILDHLFQYQQEGLLELILKTLAKEVQTKQTIWHLISKKCPILEKEKIRQLLISVLQPLDTGKKETLIKDLKLALKDDQSPYHGLCLNRHAFWSLGGLYPKGEYGKTSIWQSLVKVN